MNVFLRIILQTVLVCLFLFRIFQGHDLAHLEWGTVFKIVIKLKNQMLKFLFEFLKLLKFWFLHRFTQFFVLLFETYHSLLTRQFNSQLKKVIFLQFSEIRLNLLLFLYFIINVSHPRKCLIKNLFVHLHLCNKTRFHLLVLLFGFCFSKIHQLDELFWSFFVLLNFIKTSFDSFFKIIDNLLRVSQEF